MNKKIFLISTVLILLNLKSQEYAHPIKIDRSISGTFGELRTNHFHSGIDYRTFGKIGEYIHSIEEGYLSRIKIEIKGYGKAIYITHPKTGHTSVYAHLNTFSQKIEQIVKKMQYKRKSYTVDMVFKPDEIPIEKDEVIAYSGNSGGSMGPHLHFEIRDSESQTPLNPMKYGFLEEDSIPPIIKNIYIIPVKDIYKPSDYSNFVKIDKNDDHYLTTEVNYPFGIGINTVDKINNSISNNGVYSICLKMNGDTIYYRNLDSFSFMETRYINNFSLYSEIYKNNLYIEKCFIPRANQNLSIYNYRKHNGIIVPQNNKQYNFEFIISDERGNIKKEYFELLGGNKISESPTEEKNTILFVKNDEKQKISTNYMELIFPENTFYHNIHLPVEKADDIYNIGVAEIPSHKRYTLKILDTLDEEKDRSKYFIGYQDKNGFWINQKAEYEDKYFTCTPKVFGKFKLIEDTISPHLKILNKKISPKTKVLKIFGIDKLSGIKKFDIHANDEWILTEYDYKKNLFTLDMEEIPYEGEVTIKIYAEDFCGNSSEIQKIIYR